MAIEILVEIFYKTNLSGPHVFIDDNEILGRGGQFVVYKQRIAIPLEDSFTTQLVAFKVPKYPQDSKTPFRLFTAEAKRHIRHIYLEILALSNPSLRGHPNIADLLGWSYGDGLHTTVGLVMELAQSDLLVFLHDKDHNDISPLVKYNLCRGIAAGLDALHGCGLIHGDLKPENVLLFRSKNGAFIAKLADFGLSIYEEEGMSGVQIIGGTPGWQAPEVEKGERIDSQFLYRTDYYSFGLLVWSMFVHGGNKPPSNSRGSRNEIALSEIDQVLSHTGENMYHNLRNLLEHLLQDCPLQRFMPVGSLSNHTEEVLNQL
jgi:serine/threonine protein kinase